MRCRTVFMRLGHERSGADSQIRACGSFKSFEPAGILLFQDPSAVKHEIFLDPKFATVYSFNKNSPKLNSFVSVWDLFQEGWLKRVQIGFGCVEMGSNGRTKGFPGFY